MHPTFSLVNWGAALIAYAGAARRDGVSLRRPPVVISAGVLIFAVHAAVVFAIDGSSRGWTGLSDEQLMFLGVLGGAANAAAHSAFAQVASKKLDTDVALTMLVTESLWMFVPFAGWRRLSVLIVISFFGVFVWLRGVTQKDPESNSGGSSVQRSRPS